MLSFTSLNISKDDFLLISAGHLTQGPKVHIDEASEYDISKMRSIKIQKYEVSQYQWFKVMNNNPSRFNSESNCSDHIIINKTPLCPNHPVENVSYIEVQKFISILNNNNKNKRYRLPTEKEWEFVVKAQNINHEKLHRYANFSNKLKQTNKVRENQSINGLYNILGNVWEYTMNSYSRYEYSKNKKIHSNDKGYIVIKGGGWNSKADHIRRAYRGKAPKHIRSSDLGFRLIIE